MTVFRVIHGVPLSRDAWLDVVTAANAAYEAALDGHDYGNLMESLMVASEVAAGGDTESAAYADSLGALLRRADTAREAAIATAVLKFK